MFEDLKTEKAEIKGKDEIILENQASQQSKSSSFFVCSQH